jgi:hypothetical protein
MRHYVWVGRGQTPTLEESDGMWRVAAIHQRNWGL